MKLVETYKITYKPAGMLLTKKYYLDIYIDDDLNRIAKLIDDKGNEIGQLEEYETLRFIGMMKNIDREYARNG